MIRPIAQGSLRPASPLDSSALEPASGQRLMLRSVACWRTREEFIRHEYRCFIRGHLGLLHQTPPEVGSAVHFEVCLAGGTVMLKGTGKVAASGPRGLTPVGTLSQASAQSVAIRVEQVTARTKDLLRALLRARDPVSPKPALAKTSRPVVAPINRDALLERLRQRQNARP